MEITPLLKDSRDFTIQVFTPTQGATLTSPYSPVANEIVMLSDEAEITIDGVTVLYPAGSVIGLNTRVEYTFATDLIVHKM